MKWRKISINLLLLLISLLITNCSKSVIKETDTKINTETITIKPAPIKDVVNVNKEKILPADTSDYGTVFGGNMVTTGGDSIKIKVKIKKNGKDGKVDVAVIGAEQKAIKEIKHEIKKVESDSIIKSTIKNILTFLLTSFILCIAIITIIKTIK